MIGTAIKLWEDWDKMVVAERIRLENIKISDLLNSNFISALKENSLDLEAISLIFIGIEKKENQVSIKTLNLGHENEMEIKNKILHLSCQDVTYLEKMKNSLTKLGAK